MSDVTTFEVAVPPSHAFVWLTNPRNLISANHEGPVVEQSGGPLEAGSWFVLQFDQLQARVEYNVVERYRRIAARVTLSGFGSCGQDSSLDLVLTPLDGGSRTRVELTGDSRGGWLPRWGPLVRAQQSAWLKRMRQDIESSG